MRTTVSYPAVSHGGARPQGNAPIFKLKVGSVFEARHQYCGVITSAQMAAVTFLGFL
jgi:hypothetical protein